MFSSIEKDRSGAMEGHQWMYACMLGGASSCSVCILFILLVKDDYTSEKQFLFSNDAVKGALNED